MPNFNYTIDTETLPFFDLLKENGYDWVHTTNMEDEFPSGPEGPRKVRAVSEQFEISKNGKAIFSTGSFPI